MMHDHDNSVVAPSATTPPDITGQNRGAWEVLEEVCAQRLSGELTLTTPAPTATRVYMNNGLVYFAEHDGDDTLASRLVISGAVDDEQLRRGAIRLNGVEHLGRLFERDETVDRDAVELAIELITEMTLSEVADQPVRSFRTTMYRHHPSGINRWFSSHHTMEDEPVTGAVPVVAAAVPPIHQSVPEPAIAPLVAALEAVTPTWVAEPVVEVQPAIEPVVEPEPVVFVEPEPEPIAVVESETVVEPVAFVDPEPIAFVAPAPVVEHLAFVEPEPIAFVEPVAFVEPEPIALVEPDVINLAPVTPPAAEPYHAALDLSDLVAAMGIGITRSANPIDDDRPVVKARMWAPSITPPKPVEPPPAVPEPFNRQVDPELDALIASLVQTAPMSPGRPEQTQPAVTTTADDDGVEWFTMPSMSHPGPGTVTAPIDLFTTEPAVTAGPAIEPAAEPEPIVDLVPEPEPQPEPATAPIDLFAPEPAVTAEPEIEPEPATAPSDWFATEAAVTAEPTVNLEPSVEPEPATAPIDLFAPEPAVAAEPTVDAKPIVVEPELAVEPDPVVAPVGFIPVLPTPGSFTWPVRAPHEDAPAAERAVLGAVPQLFRLNPDGPRLPGMVVPHHEPAPVVDNTAEHITEPVPVVDFFEPAHVPEPVHTIEPTPIASLGTLSALTPIAPLEAWVTPAPMVPVVSPAPLATVHPIRDLTTAAVDPERPPTTSVAAPAYFIPELGSIPVPEDVAAAVRRAISAIEAATVSTGPAPVTFGPLHVTSYAQRPVAAEPAAAPTTTGIQPVQSANGHVTPLLSLNGNNGLMPMTPTVTGAPTTPTTPTTGSTAMNTGGIPLSAATMPFPEIEFPELPPAEELLSNPQAAPISTQRRGALRRLIDGIRRR